MGLGTLDHPAWRALAGTIVGYGLLLAVLFGLLFVVPYLLVGAL